MGLGAMFFDKVTHTLHVPCDTGSLHRVKQTLQIFQQKLIESGLKADIKTEECGIDIEFNDVASAIQFYASQTSKITPREFVQRNADPEWLSRAQTFLAQNEIPYQWHYQENKDGVLTNDVVLKFNSPVGYDCFKKFNEHGTFNPPVIQPNPAMTSPAEPPIYVDPITTNTLQPAA